MSTEFKPTHIYKGKQERFYGKPCEVIEVHIRKSPVTADVKFEDGQHARYVECRLLGSIWLDRAVTLHPPGREEERNYKPDHYHSGGIDTWAFSEANMSTDKVIGFHLINVLKYVSRHEKKNGLEDLKKALDSLREGIRLYEKQQSETDS